VNGFLNILKPPGMTSAGVVGHVKWLLKGEKVGHAGTLDPEAAGVLPLMIGRGARLFDYLVDKEKAYVAEVAFGASTDTQDAQGKVLERGDKLPSKEAILAALPKLEGTITQVPSAFSAIKQNGRPLYDMARKGEAVDVPARQVEVKRIILGEQTGPEGWMLHIKCGRGTYVRTLCHDLGLMVGCPAHMRFLLRSQSGFFTLDNAVTLEQLRDAKEAGELEKLLLPMDAPLGHLPQVIVPQWLKKACRNGAKLPLSAFRKQLPEAAQGQPVRIYQDGHFYGIGEIREDNLAFKAMFPAE